MRQAFQRLVSAAERHQDTARLCGSAISISADGAVEAFHASSALSAFKTSPDASDLREGARARMAVRELKARRTGPGRIRISERYAARRGPAARKDRA